MDFRKTALDDDAYIYQKHPHKTEKEKWKEMNWQQRRQYFVDYYLFKVIAGALLLFIVIFLLVHFLGPKEETILYAAVIDESLDESRLEQMEDDLNQILGGDGNDRRVIIDDTFYTRKDALTRLEAYLHSSQIDVIIADRETWEEYAGYGFFQNIADVLEKIQLSDKTKTVDGTAAVDETDVLDTVKLKLYEDRYMNAAGYLDSDEISFEDQETGQGKVEPYGIDLSDSSRFNEMKSCMEQPVFSVAEGAENLENAVRFLNYLMEEDN